MVLEELGREEDEAGDLYRELYRDGTSSSWEEFYDEDVVAEISGDDAPG